jgi:hypothetical protein
MANCASYNCQSLSTWESTLDNCATYRAGGSSSIILLACDHTITDPTDLTAINAEIAAGRAWRMENVKVGFTPGSPETVAPVTSCGTERVINNTYSVTIFASQVSSDNTTFINALTSGYVIGGLMFGVCPTDGLTDMLIYADAEISFQGGLVLPDTNADVIRYEMTASFKGNVETYPDTEGVF